MSRNGLDRCVLRVAVASALTALAAMPLVAQSLTRGKGSPREGSGASVAQIPLDQIVITPSAGKLVAGATIAHTARGIWRDGTERKLTAIWRSSDPDVATVDRAGNVTARKSGIVTITAEAEGVRGTKTYAVTRKPAERSLIDLPNKPLRSGDTA